MAATAAPWPPQLDGTIDVTQVFSTGYAFAALRADGSVVTWGSAYSGGDSSAVATQLDGTIDVTQVFSTTYAFAALRADGSVVTLGRLGGDSSAVATQLDGTIDVTQVFSTEFAFAALRADDSVVTWGLARFGGNSSAVTDQLHGVVSMANPFTNDVYTSMTGRIVIGTPDDDPDLTGETDDDRIYGLDGNDTLDGGAGIDTMSGGDGSDTYHVRDLGDLVIEINATASTGGIDLVNSYLSSYSLGTNVEKGRILSSSAANLTGNSLGNVLYAGVGNNILDGSTGTDTVSYAYGVSGTTGVTVSLALTSAQDTGGSASDTLLGIENLTGSAYADRLTGNSRANVLNGGAGVDTMTGGDGSDTYYVREVGDLVIETNATASTGGIDLVRSYLSSYSLGTNVENGRIHSPGEANLTGNSLGNVLYAGVGNNVLDGSTGTDTVSYAYGVSGTTGVTVSLALTSAQATGGSASDTLLGIENLTGSAYADRLIGNNLANVLDGGAGIDTMIGGDGSDTYDVRDLGDLVIEINATASTGGIDLVNSYLSSYSLGTNVENGRILSFGEANLTGNSRPNTLYAGVGNNVLDGSTGTDTVSYAYGVSGTTGVTVSLALTSAQDTGGSASDTLVGIENLTGSAYADRLTGNNLDNVLDGGAGVDTMSGGDGSDTYHVRDLGDLVIEINATASTGGIDLVNSYLSSYSLGTNVEKGRILSSSAANLTGNSLGNVLYAGVGNNILDGSTGTDTVSYAYGVSGTTGVTVSLALTSAQDTGGSASDTLLGIENLTGSAYADRLTGNSRANVLNGGAGVDTMTGGDGSDTYYVREVGDLVIETNATASTGGIDLVRSYLSSYSLGTNVENGRIHSPGDADLTGNSLGNVLYAGVGNNVLDGSTGTDTVSYAYGVSGTTGVTVSLALTSAQATGGSASDTLVGIENLTGSAYADRLTGNSAANVLTGGLGKDLLTGGDGSDTFDFNTLSEMGLTSDTWDVISDFVPGVDRIDLSSLDANEGLAGNQAFSAPVVGGTFSGAFAQAGDLYFDNVTQVLYGNTDADTAAEFAIQFVGVSALAASDLFL
jgi:Ca2+-binding RTX toxin-like protein